MMRDDTLDRRTASSAIGALARQHLRPRRTSRSDLGLRDAEDEPIFMAAREAGAVVITKDADFELLLARFGPPPKVIWITCGNTTNGRLREILARSLPAALRLLEAGESLVEIAG